VTTCPSCGGALKQDARFCVKCGASVSPAAPPPVQSGATCPRCGTVVSGGKRFCTRCGTPLAAHQATSPISSPSIAPNEAFKKVEEKYSQLKSEFSAGRITCEQFDSALKDLMIEHGGRYWMLGANSGKWYVHNGKNWVESDRPMSSVSTNEFPTNAGLRAPSKPNPQDNHSCRKCGSPILQGKKFCTTCGAPVVVTVPGGALA
jgi:predicted amidophosphoribosyltransferase